MRGHFLLLAIAASFDLRHRRHGRHHFFGQDRRRLLLQNHQRPVPHYLPEPAQRKTELRRRHGRGCPCRPRGPGPVHIPAARWALTATCPCATTLPPYGSRASAPAAGECESWPGELGLRKIRKPRRPPRGARRPGRPNYFLDKTWVGATLGASNMKESNSGSTVGVGLNIGTNIDDTFGVELGWGYAKQNLRMGLASRGANVDANAGLTGMAPDSDASLFLPPLHRRSAGPPHGSREAPSALYRRRPRLAHGHLFRKPNSGSRPGSRLLHFPQQRQPLARARSAPLR